MKPGPSETSQRDRVITSTDGLWTYYIEGAGRSWFAEERYNVPEGGNECVRRVERTTRFTARALCLRWLDERDAERRGRRVPLAEVMK